MHSWGASAPAPWPLPPYPRFPGTRLPDRRKSCWPYRRRAYSRPDGSPAGRKGTAGRRARSLRTTPAGRFPPQPAGFPSWRHTPCAAPFGRRTAPWYPPLSGGNAPAAHTPQRPQHPVARYYTRTPGQIPWPPAYFPPGISAPPPRRGPPAIRPATAAGSTEPPGICRSRSRFPASGRQSPFLQWPCR